MIKYNFLEIQKRTNPVFLIIFFGLLILSGRVVPTTLFGSLGILIFAFLILFIGNYNAMGELRDDK